MKLSVAPKAIKVYTGWGEFSKYHVRNDQDGNHVVWVLYMEHQDQWLAYPDRAVNLKNASPRLFPTLEKAKKWCDSLVNVLIKRDAEDF